MASLGLIILLCDTTLLFGGVLGFELRVSCLLGRLDHLSHIFSPFCSGYFGEGVLFYA
jgi:hypothetical protein